LERVYFSERTHAGGLLDAIEHYGFFEPSLRTGPE
jgi:hypothetical protein